MALSADDISRHDTIRLVRIAIKCADLLPDFDTVNYFYENKKSKYIKHEIKEPFERLGTKLDSFSSAFLRPFVVADSQTQMELQKMFRDFTNKIWFVNEEMTALVMMYAKAKSISADIAEMEFSDIPLSYIKSLCDDFSTKLEKKYKTVLQLTDKDGLGLPQIIEGFNNLGKLIMHS